VKIIVINRKWQRRKDSPEKSASNEITAASRMTFTYNSTTTDKNIRKYKSSRRKNKKPDLQNVDSVI
jgi:hypothetical protein